jgi:hypothetical protein
VVLACLVVGTPLHAEITATELQIAARALSFLERPLAGRVRVGLVYSSADPRSVRQADSLQRLLEQNARYGSLELRPVRVEIGAAAQADVDLFLLTDYIGEAGTKLRGAMAAKQIACMTTDVAQVRAGTCVMGVRSSPKVEILVHREAAIASGTTFAAAFRMLITEL